MTDDAIMTRARETLGDKWPPEGGSKSWLWYRNRIARALRAERDAAEHRGYQRGMEDAAMVADDMADQHESAMCQPNKGPIPIPRHKTAANDLRCAAQAIRAKAKGV